MEPWGTWASTSHHRRDRNTRTTSTDKQSWQNTMPHPKETAVDTKTASTRHPPKPNTPKKSVRYPC
eukprot:scaffold45133_cov168-Amphora_coffeaeformis.AAC.1